MKKGVKWIRKGLVLSPLSIGLCQSEKDFKRELRRLKIPLQGASPWIPANADGQMWEFNKIKGCHGRCSIVCIRVKKKTTEAEAIGLIIHEAVHVWQSIKDHIGEKYPSAEFECYSIQSIAQRLISKYRKGQH